MPYCRACGEPLNEPSQFCEKCGAASATPVVVVEPRRGGVLALKGVLLALGLTILIYIQRDRSLHAFAVALGFALGAFYVFSYLRSWKKRNEIARGVVLGWSIAALMLVISLFSLIPTNSLSIGNSAKLSPPAVSRSLPAAPSCRTSDITVDKLGARVDYGYTHFVGRVRNGCNQAVGVQLKLTAYGSSGDILTVDDFWPASINNIPANSDFPFETLDRIGGVKSFTVNVIDVKTW